MLVSDVIDSKAIALAVNTDPSNKIPYLGKKWFKSDKKAGLDLKWIKTSEGLPVTLAASNFDALPVLRARKGLDIEKTQMAFFREQMIVSETDAQEIDRVKDANDPYLASAVKSIYNDAKGLVKSAEVVGERMIMSLLATNNGTPAINIASGDAVYAYNYDPNGKYAATHYADVSGGTTDWSASTATPVTDIANAKRALTQMGKAPKYVLMNSITFGYLLKNAEVKSLVLAQNTAPSVFISEAVVTSAIKALTGLTIVIYDKQYDLNGTATYFYPSNQFTILPEEDLGVLWHGTTPEERSAGQMAGADVSIVNDGIAISTVTTNVAPIITTITASEIVLPSYENMDSTYVVKVH